MRTITARRTTAKIFAIVASAGAVAGIGTYGAYTDTATAMRYGATWVALGGVVLLGLSLIWHKDAPLHRAPAARPRLTLVTSEPRP